MIPPIIIAKLYAKDLTIYESERGVTHFFHTEIQKKEEKRTVRYRVTYLRRSLKTLRKLEETVDQDTPVKNEKNEYFHYSCADHDETLIILKKSEIGEGDVCNECKNELEYIDPDEEDDD